MSCLYFCFPFTIKQFRVFHNIWNKTSGKSVCLRHWFTRVNAISHLVVSEEWGRDLLIELCHHSTQLMDSSINVLIDAFVLRSDWDRTRVQPQTSYCQYQSVAMIRVPLPRLEWLRSTKAWVLGSRCLTWSGLGSDRGRKDRTISHV